MGLFDTRGERLTKIMDNAMRALMSASAEIKNDALLKMDGLIEELNAEIPKWSIDGRINISKKLQRDSLKDKQFNIPSYIALALTGCWLESLNFSDDPHCTHILNTIEILRSEAQKRRPAQNSNQDDISRIVYISKTFLIVVLNVFTGRQTENLAELIEEIRELDDELINQAHAISFGFIDALAQIKNLSEPEHLIAAISFYTSDELGVDLDEAKDIIDYLMNATPGEYLFEHIREAGQAIMNYQHTGDIDSISELANTMLSV